MLQNAFGVYHRTDNGFTSLASAAVADRNEDNRERRDVTDRDKEN